MDKPKILLVDDRRENLLALEGVLRADDRTIIWAESAKRALELLIEHQFALAIVDVQMPEMNGLELAEMMRGSDDTQTIPIIFVTAGVKDQSLAFEGFEAGAVDFLYKPLNERIVRSKVKVFLELDRQKRLLQEQIVQLETSEANLLSSQQALAESNAKLERFTFMASHDMKEPLRMINSYLSLLNREIGSDLSVEQREYIGYAMNGAKRLYHLLESLIQYATAKHVRLDIKKQDTKAIVGEVLLDLSVLIAERKAHINVSELPEVDCDRMQFRQLFQNLLSNAIKFTNGKVPEIKVEGAEKGDEFCFSIHDNGIGIAEEAKAKIFEPFVRGHGRREFAGDGIGLSVCKQIVERGGGRIWVEGNEKGGSTFRFTVPRVVRPEQVAVASSI